MQASEPPMCASKMASGLLTPRCEQRSAAPRGLRSTRPRRRASRRAGETPGRRSRSSWAALLAVAAFVPLAAQDVPHVERLLSRRYVEGDRVQYLMKTQNDGSTYEVRITATTKKTSDGRFVEEFAWSDMVANSAPRALAATSQAFRLAVTLEGGAPFEIPDLSKAPGLIGPVTDLMTFYSDLFLAMHQGTLRKAGDHFYFPSPITASWADGTVVVLGEDHIDFDITLTSVDTASGVATLLVKHVPPPAPKIRLPADWMRAPVADTSNNFVQVRKTATGFAASVGKETFDVTLNVDLSDGKILSATMVNPVTKVTRECSDAAVTQCGDLKPDPTLRRIEMSLLRE
jgi:hypothetical protein